MPPTSTTYQILQKIILNSIPSKQNRTEMVRVSDKEKEARVSKVQQFPFDKISSLRKKSLPF